MTDHRPAPNGRSRRAERAQRIYSARDVFQTPGEELPPDAYAAYRPNQEQSVQYAPNEKETYTPNEEKSAWEQYTPNEDEWSGFTPNEEETWAGYTPNEETAEPQSETVDLAAYYSRDGGQQEETDAQPAFAPPPRMEQFIGGDWSEPETEPAVEAPGNVYRPREATWADTARRDVLSVGEMGYQVEEEQPPVRKRKKRRRKGRAALTVLLVLLVLAAAAALLYGPVARLLEPEETDEMPTLEPTAAAVTPEPVKAYDAAAALPVADTARSAISHLSGTVEMETYVVTDTNVVTRNRRENGSCDFYVFTAEGRLLCYFEGLDELDLIPQEGGGFFVEQHPYLISANGSALIRTSDIEAQIGETMRLHPLYRGWAVIESETDGSANYISRSGQLLSTLWFARTFPFTGKHTLAYVDTGSTADPDERYLLYLLSEDGTMERWQATSDTANVTVCAAGMAYMDNGDLYRLPDVDAPLLNTKQAEIYLDCGAVVVHDALTGKAGLFVHGEQHYGFEYDSIRPVESDIVWGSQSFAGEGGVCTLHAVSGADYPQPLSYSFVLEKDGQQSYVALSTQSSYPIRLEGEY